MTERDAGRIVVWIDSDLKAIVPDFFDFRRKDVAALTELVAQGDFVRIRAIGHNLKGSGGVLADRPSSHVRGEILFVQEVHR